ncbi:GNAT family N-acetyltransferase [Mangrovicoccus algicola]|uniref:GNAT family N-acetyltransferase n=1 Tax=Mangrovicoccus algicola TaxID=2771008 RepID=A0A8J6ZBC7_9RHOB|nr:GNAT family N-acetyltransferase [Mangrovicoccus algicola]MBE3639641.1 GNAT family N-acetyltransferase [Mangrovicoccus algicola]
MSEPHIRAATAADTDRVYEICRRTAAAGEDGSHLYSDPRMPGYLYSAAYLKLQPDCAFVLDIDGQAAGYVIGTPDTAAFEARLLDEWWPWVRRQTEGMQISRPKDQMAADRIARPRAQAPGILADYPAHLHINLLPQAQSGGWGRRMIETQLENMRRRGVSGLHLGLDPDNHRAAGFYRHIGFTDISPADQMIYGIRLDG